MIRSFTNTNEEKKGCSIRQLKNKLSTDEIALIEKSQTEMRISSWLFHMTFKKQIIHI